MKNLRIFTIAFLFFWSFANKTYAQMEESRNKIEMTLSVGGKTAVAELGSLSTSISRSDEVTLDATVAKDSAKKEMTFPRANSFYLTMEIRRMTDDLFRMFGKKQNKFEGTITVVDTYGKFPTRTYKFKGAVLTSYSDQMAAASYGENYGSGFISLSCSDISINGINIE